MHRGPQNLRIAADGVGLTQFAGVSLIEEFFRRIGLRRALARQVRFAQRNNWYSIGEPLEALLYPLVLGLGRIETTEPLRTTACFTTWPACRVTRMRPPGAGSSIVSLVGDETPS